MANKTVSVAAGSWPSAGTWDEGAQPTNVENVVARAGGDSGNLNADNASDTCADLTLTNYSGTLAMSANLAVKGSMTLPGTMAFTGSGGTLSFTATATGKTITSNGIAIPRPVTFNGAGGGWTLQDAWDSSASGTTSVLAGAFHSNGKAVAFNAFSSTGSGTRTVDIANSTVTCLAGTTFWTVSGSNVTVTATGSVIKTPGTAGTRTFAGGGFVYGGLEAKAGAGLTITGANTFDYIDTLATSAHTLTLPASTTTTLASQAASAPNGLQGIPGKLLSIVSSSSGTAATLSAPAGQTIRFNHCSIKDIAATGGATFEAYDCIDVSGNSGITFKTPPKLALLGVG